MPFSPTVLSGERVEEDVLCASLRRSKVAGPLPPPPPPPPLDGVEITTLPAETRAAAGRTRTYRFKVENIRVRSICPRDDGSTRAALLRELD